MQRDRFVGEIASAGTASGHRIVVGRWIESPFGSFADVMHEAPDGVRTLHAPNDQIAEYISSTYVFDEVVVHPIDARRPPGRLVVEGGPWSISLRIGRRTLLGALLRLLPRRVATAPRWCALVDPVARVLLRDVRTRGTAGSDRVESYGAVDQHRVADVTASFEGRALGGLADVHPPVRFGFSSTPRRPGIVALTTTIEMASPGVGG